MSPSSYSQAVTIPNTFTSGTPAKAADVNANFNALATAIDSLQKSISALQVNSNGGGTPTANCSSNLHVTSYSNSTSSVGQIVTIAGIKFTIHQFPIYEIETGKHYSIKIPLASNSGQDDKVIQINTKHVSKDYQNSLLCAQTITGYPATIAISDGINYVLSKNSYNSAYNSFAVFGQVTVDLSILINQTLISFSFGMPPFNGAAYTKTQPSYIQSDFITGFAWANITPVPDTWITPISQIINYVAIEKLP